MQKQTERSLRLTLVATFPPALLFLLLHGIFTGYVCPALGIVPMFVSAVGALVQLSNKLSKNASMLLDAFSAVFMLVMLIPAIIESVRSRGAGLLGGYGTAFMWINLGIHIYFILSPISLRSLWPSRHCRRCTCSDDGRGQEDDDDAAQGPAPRGGQPRFARDRKDGYAAVEIDDDDDHREYRDGEHGHAGDESEPRTSTSTSILTVGGWGSGATTGRPSQESDVTLV